MTHSQDQVQRSTRPRERNIPASIRRQFGYPSPVRGRTDDLADDLAEMVAQVQQLTERVAALEAQRAEEWVA